MWSWPKGRRRRAVERPEVFWLSADLLDRTTVVLRDIEGLSYEQIAEILQVSLGTVKSRLMRGRVALKKRLEDYARQAGRDLGLNIVRHGGEVAPLEVGTK